MTGTGASACFLQHRLWFMKLQCYSSLMTCPTYARGIMLCLLTCWPLTSQLGCNHGSCSRRDTLDAYRCTEITCDDGYHVESDRCVLNEHQPGPTASLPGPPGWACTPGSGFTCAAPYKCMQPWANSDVASLRNDWKCHRDDYDEPCVKREVAKLKASTLSTPYDLELAEGICGCWGDPH